MGHVEKLDYRFLQNKTETFLVSVTHLILRFANVQNKFQQTNKTNINHLMTTTSSLRFFYILSGSGLLCATPHWRLCRRRGDGGAMRVAAAALATRRSRRSVKNDELKALEDGQGITFTRKKRFNNGEKCNALQQPPLTHTH